MRKRHQRLVIISFAAPILILAATLVLLAIQDSVEFFFGPSDLLARNLPPSQTVRLGGLVEEGSVSQLGDGAVQFSITDGQSALAVVYKGILPDLFREGQGIVATGTLTEDRIFAANQVLAKHDETYMPPDVADMLKEQGHWQDNQDAYPANDGAAGSANP